MEVFKIQIFGMRYQNDYNLVIQYFLVLTD